MQLRPVRGADVPGLLGIYAPYVRDTAVTFEYEVPTLEAFAARVRSIAVDYPYLVCEADGGVVGYAYAQRQMERAAYQWNAVLSVYLAPKAQGHGLGTALYSALLELLSLMHVRNAYGCITLPNAGSRRLHEKLGFTLAGVWPHSGYKLGAWHDTGWFVRAIGDSVEEAPLPLLPFHALPHQQVEDMLRRAENQIKRRESHA